MSTWKTLLPVEARNLSNILHLIGMRHLQSNEKAFNEEQVSNSCLIGKLFSEDCGIFFNSLQSPKLQSKASGWMIPPSLLPAETVWNACAILKDDQIIRLIIPESSTQCTQLLQSLEEQSLQAQSGVLVIKNQMHSFISNKVEFPLSKKIPLFLAGASPFSADLISQSIAHAGRIQDLLFNVSIPIQGSVLKGKIPYKNVEISEAKISHLGSDSTLQSEQQLPFWMDSIVHENGEISYLLPNDPDIGEGIALPKSFRDAGVFIGDQGSLSYLSPTTSTLQEQRIPVYVAGFYDPGIIPIGGKFILANPETTTIIRASHERDDQIAQTAGINVRFENLSKVDKVKASIVESLKNRGIHRYWNVETYREYEFTKNIMQELQSQKNLFMLIAVVIIIVACSNIISMLIILVNDKKGEIGILRSMGATSKNIGCIFGIAGALIGVIGSGIGIAAAILTLHHLDSLIQFLSLLQGHEMLSAHLYGQILPQELSTEALSFVLIATVCISLFAGIIPAIKACMMRPSQILRSAGT